MPDHRPGFYRKETRGCPTKTPSRCGDFCFAYRSRPGSPVYKEVKNISDWAEVEKIRTSLDFLIVSNPTFLYQEVLGQVFHWGRALFIKKPLSHQLSTNEVLVNNLATQNTPTDIACNLRFLDSMEFVQHSLKNEQVQEVNAYVGSYLPDWRPNKDFRKS